LNTKFKMQNAKLQRSKPKHFAFCILHFAL